jgi:two-component system, sensor histidine kinase and response regulator
VTRTDPGSANGPQDDPNAPRADQAQAGGAGSSQDPALVLIVEDEEPIADAIAYLVEDHGYIPLRASNGREALELARARRPRLIITDLMMPVMDGAQLIAALRDEAASDGASATPVILTTAGGFHRAEEAGADAILRKPFDITDVEDLLDRFLGPPRAGS